MSGQALIWAANVRGLKPMTKIVLIQLSERHNKDTGLCNPSIKTLADDCEMDRSTVIRHLESLETFGLVTRVRKGNDDGGRASNEYVLHMPEQVKTDVSTHLKSQSATGVKSQSDGGLSRRATGVKSQSRATRTCSEPDSEPEDLFGSIEPHNEREASHQLGREAELFDRLWLVYPKSGRKDKPDAKRKFVAVLKAGADPERLISAARRYADWLESGGKNDFRPNPKHLATWLNKGSWNDDIPDQSPQTGRHRVSQPFGEVYR